MPHKTIQRIIGTHFSSTFSSPPGTDEPRPRQAQPTSTLHLSVLPEFQELNLLT